MPRHLKRRPERGSTNRKPARPARARRLHWGRLILAAAGLVAVLGAGVVTDLIVRAVATLPRISDPAHTLGQTSVLYDAAGQAVATVPGPVNRTPLPLSKIPPMLQHAFIAVEDRYYYQDHGISIRGILRAAVADLRGEPLQGGSTITQQLAKNIYLTPRDTLTRKIKEAILALEMNRRYTKSQILDMYLNWIYLGERAYGVQAAAESYFGKPLDQLTVTQDALLAGLPQAPVGYDPYLHPKAATARRNVVLQVMAQQHYITAARARADQAKSLELAPQGSGLGTTYPYPWFVDAVITQLEQQYHFSPQEVTSGGLRIYTTLNPAVYNAAQKAVTTEMNRDFPLVVNGKKVSDPMQAAVVIMNQSNGNVLAVIGGRTHTAMLAYDRATQAEQQTGSAIKPLVDYIPALQAGYTAGTTVNDVLKAYDLGPGQPLYMPVNYNYLWYGLTTFTEALRRSVNAVAVQVLNRVGILRGIANAQRMGLTNLSPTLNDHLALALGGTVGCCTPLEMADAYATIANGGDRVTPRFITKVVAPDGQVLLNNPPHLQAVISPAIAYVMTKMLETVDTPQPNHGWDVVSGPYDSNWGTGYDAQVQDNIPGWPMAAKTGTTNSNRQAWYLAYTPLYTGAVWVGQDQPQPNPNLFGDTYAGPILKAAMTVALQGKTVVHFNRPPGVVEAPIDIMAPAWSVAKPGPLTPPQYIRNEWFVAGTQPTQISPLWVQRQVDSANPTTLWAPGCAGQPVTKTFLNLGAEGSATYGPAWAQQRAAALHTSDWQQFIPIDTQLEPPTQLCPGGTIQKPGSPGLTPGGAATSGPSSTAPTPCVADWNIRVVAGGTLQPAAICVPLGQEAQLTFSSADGLAHTVDIQGYGVTVAIPSTGSPITVHLLVNRPLTALIVDAASGVTVGRVIPGS